MQSPSKGRVLFVDDEEDLREVISEGLTLHGFEVAQAESAEVALTMLESARFDLILTDLQLRGMDGIELAKRAVESWRIPVVLLTAQASIGAAAAAVRARLDDFLEKPVDLEGLVLVLDRAIERSKMKEAVERLHEKVAVSTRLDRKSTR